MDDWLMKKKIEEAERVASMREMERLEEQEKQLVNERQTNCYKDWMRLQTMKNKATRKYSQRQQRAKDDVLVR